MLGFNLGGEEQRALAGRVGGFQSQIFSGGLVEGALREGRSVQQERQYERQSQQGLAVRRNRVNFGRDKFTG